MGILSSHAANAFSGAKHFDSQEHVVAQLRIEMNKGMTVLVKGSRGSRMEQVVKPLIEASPKQVRFSEVDAADSSEVISL